MTVTHLSNNIGPQIAFVSISRIDSMREPCETDTKEIIYERFALLCGDIISALRHFTHSIIPSSELLSSIFKLAFRSKVTIDLSKEGQRRSRRFPSSAHSTAAFLSIFALALWIVSDHLLDILRTAKSCIAHHFPWRLTVTRKSKQMQIRTGPGTTTKHTLGAGSIR